MITVRGLSALLPQTFQDILTPNQTSPQRLASWIQVAHAMRIDGLDHVSRSFRYMDGSLVPESLGGKDRRSLVRLLHVNREPLECLRDSSKTPSLVVLPVPLEDCPVISQEDYQALVSRVPPLLSLCYLGIRYSISMGIHSDTLGEIESLFTIGARLLASSFPGVLNHQGLYCVHSAYIAAVELADRASAGQDSILAALITRVENNGVRATDYLRAQFLQFCTNVFYAIYHCPDTHDLSEIVRYFHESEYLRAVLSYRAGQPADESSLSASDYTRRQRHEQSNAHRERLRLAVDRLFEDHSLPFDKTATLGELRDTLSFAWRQLDQRPSRVRELCTTMIQSRFHSGVHDAFVTAMVSGRHVNPNTLREVEEHQTSARSAFSDMPNPIGRLLVFDVKRVFFQHLALTISCWYYLRLIEEVTRCLLGIKAFSLRKGELPTSLSETVEMGFLRSLPKDPFSQTDLQYMPDRQIVCVDPQCDEIRRWETNCLQNQGFAWSILGN